MLLSTKVSKIEIFENPKKGGDFTQIKRLNKDNLDYEVHEYGNPKQGYWGYQVLFYEQKEDGEYVKSVGYGEESKNRTYDWTKVEVEK